MLAHIEALDRALLRFLHLGDAPFWLVLLTVVVTFLGSGWMLLALVPALANPKLRRPASWLLGAVLGTSLLVWTVKAIVDRVRPCNALAWASAVWVTPPAGPSFPSGHSAGSFAFAAFVFMVHRRWGLLASLVAALVGLSRVALGVHYPSDVLAGAILGTAVGGLVGLRAMRSLRQPASS